MNNQSSQTSSTLQNKSQTKDILTDTLFQEGFIVLGKTHESGVAGKLYPAENSKDCDPQWRIAQWACNNNIAAGKRTQNQNGYTYETPSQRVTVEKEAKDAALTLELKSSKEYKAARKAGEAWPHLLIEQQNLQMRCPTLNKVQSLDFQITSKVLYCERKMENPNSELHTAQCNLFFTVQSLKDGDMYWFGVPFFDERYIIQDEYMAVDGGKTDASQKFIYIAAQNEFTGKSFHSNELITYHKDLYPLIVKGLNEAKKRGYLNSTELSEYTLTTMNIGWEMPGTYDAAFTFKGLSLKAQIIEN